MRASPASPSSARLSLRAPTPAATGATGPCPVCAFPEVRADWVRDRGWVLLQECPRCQHRTTQPVPEPAPMRVRTAATGVAAA